VMALTVNWASGLITCPQSDLTLVSGTRYEITVTRLWELLRDRSDDEDALAYPILFSNIPPTASTPRIVEINDDYYTFQFENGLYSVDVINGNTNLRDVEVKNQVSVGTNNNTGFVEASGGGASWDSNLDDTDPDTFGGFIQKLLTVAKFIGLK
jgi:hypothetical protein